MSESTKEIGEVKSREEIAMDKVIDPYNGVIPYSHSTGVEKLDSILQNGLVAGNFAYRAKVQKYHKGFGSSWNEKYVSLSKISPEDFRFWDMWGVKLLVMPNETPMLASDELIQETDDLKPHSDEYLVRNRISPKEIIGIVMEEGRKQPDVGSRNVSLEDIKGIMFNLDPSLSLPVYSDKNGLLWPKRMTREELKDYVESRR